MARKSNDGRGRLGGRTAGTPNKSNPFKSLLHAHSEAYFTPSIPAAEAFGDLEPELRDALRTRFAGQTLSQFDIDLISMRPLDRARTEVDLLAYHTPKMQSVSADMSIKDTNRTLTDRIISLAQGKDPD